MRTRSQKGIFQFKKQIERFQVRDLQNDLLKISSTVNKKNKETHQYPKVFEMIKKNQKLLNENKALKKENERHKKEENIKKRTGL